MCLIYRTTLGCLLVQPCSVINIKRNLQQPNPSRTSNVPDPLGLKAFNSPSKEPPPVEMLADEKRIQNE